MAPIDRPLRRAPGLVSSVSIASAFVWAIAVIYHPVLPAASPDLDPSWAQALGQALLRGFDFGRDIVFPYGPMGTFWAPLYQPELYFWHFMWELVVGSLQATVVVCAVLAWTSVQSRLLVFAAVISALGVSHDATAFMTIVAGVLLLARREGPHPGLILPVLSACVLLSLAKFTCLLLAAACFVGLGLALAARGRWRAAIGYTLGFVLLFVAAWAAAGQPLDALFAYLGNSWEIATGFSRAMSTAYDPIERRLGLAVTVAALALLLMGSLQRRSGAQAALSAVVAAGLLVAWKAGFVRATDHSTTTFAFAVLSPLWIGLLPTLHGRVRACGSVVLVALGMAGLTCSEASLDWARTPYQRPIGTWIELSAPGEARSRLEHALAETKRAHSLPRIRERVGDASIDALPWGAAIVFLNDLDWQPRPIFQSYSAYTSELSRLNAVYFREGKRPRFIIVHDGAIDRRHPLHDDGEAWAEILRLYDPVLYEQGYLLFEERASPPSPSAPTVLLETEVDPGEEIDVSAFTTDTCYVGLELELKESPLGRLHSLLDRSPSVHLYTRFDSGDLARHRLVPEVAGRGFLISPAAHGAANWLFHFQGARLARPTSLELDVRSRDGKYFEWPATVRVLSFDEVFERGCEERLALGGMPGFSRLPNALAPPDAFQFFDGSPRGLLAHPPSRMIFELQPGPHSVGLEYAIGEGAYTRGATDGVVFTAALVEGADGEANEESGPSRRILLERELRPMSVEGDRGVQRFEAGFELNAPGQLVLETASGAAGDAHWDWSVWIGVDVDEAVEDTRREQPVSGSSSPSTDR